jgi:hypothetical protein
VVARGRWASPVHLLVCSAHHSGGPKIAPWPGRIRLVGACDRPSAPEEQKTERTRLSRLFHWGSAPSADELMLPDRGVRERLCAYAGCHAAPSARIQSVASTVRSNTEKSGIVLSACATVRLRSGVATARQSSFSQLKLSENRRKQFHLKRRAHCVQRRHQRFPTVRTVGEIGNGEVRAKMPDIRACASTAM